MAVARGEFTLNDDAESWGKSVYYITGRYSEVARKERGKWVYAVGDACYVLGRGSKTSRTNCSIAAESFLKVKRP